MHLLRQDFHRAESAGLADVDLPFLGGVHHDGNGGRFRIALDGRDRFETIHAGHGVVHEDDVDGVVLDEVERFFAGKGLVDLQVVLLEQLFQRKPRGFRIVDDQRTFE